MIKIVPKSVWPNPLQWYHNGCDAVSNHQPNDCLPKRLCGRSKKTPKLLGTGICAWNSPTPENSPHKWPVTRKMFIFHDVTCRRLVYQSNPNTKRNPTNLLRIICQGKRFTGLFVRFQKGSKPENYFWNRPIALKFDSLSHFESVR